MPDQLTMKRLSVKVSLTLMRAWLNASGAIARRLDLYQDLATHLLADADLVDELLSPC